MRKFVLGIGLTLWVVASLSTREAFGAETLYNGITLPAPWPPRVEKLAREPMEPPYLKNPPKIVPVDVGRQLFVDDFLIESTTLKRTFHRPVYIKGNPVLRADKPWERKGRAPCAMPFSDGVWWDPQARLFKLWYIGGYLITTCYAESRDGIEWKKPNLDIEPGTNVVLRQRRDSATVWLDWEAKKPSERWKLFITRRNERTGRWHLDLRTSGDGIHWSKTVASSSKPIGDRTTVFYNPFRKKWVYSLRISYNGRARAYREQSDPAAGLNWTAEDTRLWVGADRLDPHNPNPKFADNAPQLYNLDAVGYESLIVGLFAIWQGPPNRECHRLHIQKRNELLVGFTRDGFHWHRPSRERFLGVNPTKGAWNWGNVQSAGGCFLVVGDKLYFYVSGRALSDSFWDGNCHTGLAVMRRDGFASMDATEKEGVLSTRPLKFKGTHLFVNVKAPAGELRAEILDSDFRVIEPFTRERCRPVSDDTTLREITWKGVKDLSAVAGKPVRIRFHLRNGSLYSFWVTPDSSGASHGYVAAGGPGFTGPTDTVGRGAYKAAETSK